MKTKIFSVLSLILCIVLIAGCGKKDDDEYGDIKDVLISVENQTVDGKETENEFNATSTELDYKWEYAKVGRAMLSIPYPSTWTLKRDTDYKLAFTAPETDPHFPGVTVFFHSTLESEAVQDSDYIRDRFKSDLRQDRYTYAGHTYTLKGSSQIDQIVVNEDIIDPDTQLQKTYRDYQCAAIKGALVGGDFASDMYREINCFYWHSFPCVLTAIVPDEDADKLSDLLNYMFTNAAVIDERIADTADITVFPNTTNMTIPMSPLYTRCSIDTGKKFESAVGFYCPPNSSTGYSHSFLNIYETKTKNFNLNSKNFEDEYLDTILKGCFGVGTDKITIYGHMDSDDGTVKFGKDAKAGTKEYIYLFNVDSGKLPDGVFPTQYWEIDMYPIEHGEYTDLVCLIAPYDGQPWAFDLIKLMTVKLKYVEGKE